MSCWRSAGSQAKGKVSFRNPISENNLACRSGGNLCSFSMHETRIRARLIDTAFRKNQNRKRQALGNNATLMHRQGEFLLDAALVEGHPAVFHHSGLAEWFK